jgi:hypothetical protein
MQHQALQKTQQQQQRLMSVTAQKHNKKRCKDNGKKSTKKGEGGRGVGGRQWKKSMTKQKWRNNNDKAAWCKRKNDDVGTKAKNVASCNPFYDQKKPLNEKVATKQKRTTKQKKLQKERVTTERKNNKNSVLYVGEGSILTPLHLYIKTSGFL